MLVRRAARSAALLTVPAVALMAGPAHASFIPEGWAEPTSVDPLHLMLIIGFAPIGLALVIALLAAAPALARGRGSVTPASEGTWIGGPRSGTDELPAADGEESRAGGASGSF